MKSSHPVYTIDYFIDKFVNIPTDKWIVGGYTNELNQCCALGHCGERNEGGTEESKALTEIFVNGGLNVVRVNDGGGYYPYRFIHTNNPRERIISALMEIKLIQS